MHRRQSNSERGSFKSGQVLSLHKPAHDRYQPGMPQRPPGAQLAAFVAARVPPLTLLEKRESFFFICWLSQVGQMTSPIADELLRSLSNESPQSRQTNSKIGI
jgi:hypothetical protein